MQNPEYQDNKDLFLATDSVRQTRLMQNQKAVCRGRLFTFLLALCLAVTVWCSVGLSVFAQNLNRASVWEGDVVAPRWTAHNRLLLKQDGSKFSGWIWETGQGGNAEPSELIGEQVGTSEFRIETRSGFVYLGRFADANTVTGVRPNGDEKDKSIPRFPFRFIRVRNALGSDFPPALPETSADWNVFFTRFKTAVRSRDSSALAAIMIRKFDTGSMSNSTEAFLNGVDWRQLTKTISQGVKPCKYKPPTVKEANCAIDTHPCPNCRYQMFVSFEKGTDDQWRWASMLASGD